MNANQREYFLGLIRVNSRVSALTRSSSSLQFQRLSEGSKLTRIVTPAACDDRLDLPGIPNVVERAGRQHHEIRDGAHLEHADRVGTQQLCSAGGGGMQ